MRYVWIIVFGVVCVVAVGATVLVSNLLLTADESRPIAAAAPVAPAAAPPVAAAPGVLAPGVAGPMPGPLAPVPAGGPPAFVGMDPRLAQRQVVELERELAFFQNDFGKITRTYREEALKALASLPAPVMATPSPSRLGAALALPGKALLDHLPVPPGKGLVVAKLAAGGPAERAGLQPSDILLEFDGQPVPRDLARFKKMCDSVPPKRAVDLVILRQGKHVDIKGLTFPEAPAPVAVAAPPARGPAACVK